MRIVPSLPAEIQQLILRYGISVQDFLDPDAFEGALSDFQLSDKHCERNKEETYWLAERRRNKFRRVCKSWNGYLRQFEHRFVRMLDIWHEKIPLIVLRNAVRLSFGLYECKCSKFCAPEIQKRRNTGCVFTAALERTMFFGEVCIPLLEKVGSLNNLLIFDAKSEVIWCKGLLQLSKNAGNLKVFLGRIQESIGVCRCLYPRLDVADYPHVNGHRRWQLPRDHPETLPASSLASMSLTDFGHMRNTSDSLEWNAPSLRHLRIGNPWHVQGQYFLEYAVYPFLQSVGSNLYTLYLSSPGPEFEYDLPNEIWEMCPRLEKLGTTMRLVSPPPISHPFNTYVAPPSNSPNGGVSFLHWPHLQRVVVDWVWSNTHRGDHIYPEWRRVCTERNIPLEDQNGITWNEYLSQGSRRRAFILNLVARPWM